MNRTRSGWGMCVISAIVLLPMVAGTSFGLMRQRSASAPVAPAEDEEAGGLYERAAEAAAAGDCAAALPLLDEAAEASPEDPDVFNLLGFCQRKSGQLDEAFGNYRRALDLRSRFPAARQYLGEAHLEAVLREVRTLRSYGDSAGEELRLLVAALREAADAAESDAGAAPALPTLEPKTW